MKSAKKQSSSKKASRLITTEEDTGLGKPVTLANVNTHVPPNPPAVFFDYKTYIKVSHGGLTIRKQVVSIPA